MRYDDAALAYQLASLPRVLERQVPFFGGSGIPGDDEGRIDFDPGAAALLLRRMADISPSRRPVLREMVEPSPVSDLHVPGSDRGRKRGDKTVERRNRLRLTWACDQGIVVAVDRCDV